MLPFFPKNCEELLQLQKFFTFLWRKKKLVRFGFVSTRRLNESFYNDFVNDFVKLMMPGGPVVQGIISLISLLRGQLIKRFLRLYNQINLYFFVGKMREAFAKRKLLTFFQQKILAYESLKF